MTPAAFVWIALLAACQPLPHPFADDRPPADLLAVPESAAVSIAPVEGDPKLIAAELGGATARALLRREIPASDKIRSPRQLSAVRRLTASRLRGSQSSVAVRWRLEDAGAAKLGEREARIEGTADEWQSAGGAMIDRLAALSADAVAPLLVKTPAAPNSPLSPRPNWGLDRAGQRAAGAAPDETADAGADGTQTGHPRPRLGDTRRSRAAGGSRLADEAGNRAASGRRARQSTGAPGDGAAALARAMTGVLRQQDLAIVEPGGKADFTSMARYRSRRPDRTSSMSRSYGASATRAAPNSAMSARKTTYRAPY